MGSKAPHEFSTQVKAPANIAWIKYWGKKGPQLPANPSLSMTLRECVTLTQLEATPASGPKLELWFQGERSESFEAKTLKFLQEIARDYPLLNEFHFKIQSENTFPHSSGIASSASSMAALAFALGQLLRDHAVEINRQEIGSLARRGSGSACRSLEGGLVSWGATPLVEHSSDQHATAVTKSVHPSFQHVRDTVLIVSSEEKELSSRAGHGAMNGHPFAEARYQEAQRNFSEMWSGLLKGDWERVGELMEAEALTLHALLMSQAPVGTILLAPKSLEIIRLVRLFRKQSGLPLYFTIDAGPNIHLIYPDSAHSKVDPFIRHELLPFTEQGNSAIWDSMGEAGAR